MSQPQDDDDGTTELVAHALAEYAKRPSPEDVARLVDMLLTRGQDIHDIVAARPRQDLTAGASDALYEWEYFSRVGPLGSGPHANWNHCRALARIIKRLMHMAHAHTTASAS
ncbi:DUF6415 family natural product biosynthesis protein [Streptomyces sp. NPDC097981]|uniref:DUF6415 family natural product biosynthesis protein n=1 Tax=Streptomyces sp. NPDC097981 TaxID=3155428 RepID=UPI00332C7F5D